MADFIFKLRILWGLLASQYEYWRRDVLPNNLDVPYCCDGRECGCYAMTLRDIYSPSVGKTGDSK